jgi:hypothetical protein
LKEIVYDKLHKSFQREDCYLQVKEFKEISYFIKGIGSNIDELRWWILERIERLMN